jgi:hypothetical protein
LFLPRFSFHTSLDRDCFEFRGLYHDKPKDLQQRLLVAMSIVDYKDIPSPGLQFEMADIVKEISRAFICFMVNPWESEKVPEVVSTGHWNCDKMGGADRQLRAIIQLIAASEVGP